MWTTLFFLTAALLNTSLTDGSELKALRFPESLSTENFVTLTPNLESAERTLSVCGWLKKSRDTSYGVGAWFNYGWVNYGITGRTTVSSSEILLMDGMREIYMFGASGGVSGLRTSLDTWQHNCLVWTGPPQKTLQAYVDGDLKIHLDYYSPSPRELVTNGTVILGQYRQRTGVMRGTVAYAGDMYNINLFRRPLTAEEVGAMYRKGVCGELSDDVTESVLVGWSVFLEGERHGAAHEVPVDCSRWNRLRAFVGQLVSEGLIEHLKKFHDD